MSELSEFLLSQGEWFAAGFFEQPEAPPVRRMALALRRQFENTPLPAVGPQPLYPAGAVTLYATRYNVFTFHYSYSAACSAALRERIDDSPPDQRRHWEALRNALDAYPLSPRITSPRYTLGGAGWTHSIPNSGASCAKDWRAIAPGSSPLAGAEAAGQAEQTDFFAGLEDTLAGVEALHRRMAAQLAALESPQAAALAQAYRIVPFKPARTFFEALVAVNFLFYLDGCDSLGHLDQVLAEFYAREIRAGTLTREGAVALMRALWRNFDDTGAWNVAIGPTGQSGCRDRDEFTLVCLEAMRGMRRPNLALKIGPNTTPECWQAALDCLATGCGQPALYNDSLYRRALAAAGLGVRAEDLPNYAFAGCTETMVHGCSNVGSLDAGINLLEILHETLQNDLAACATFEQLLAALRERLGAAIDEMLEQVNADQQVRAEFRPHMIRSLLVDDCIDAGKEFNAGGARYNWSVVNVGGLANVADSLAAIRELLYEQAMVSPSELLGAMRRNFAGDEGLRQAIALPQVRQRRRPRGRSGGRCGEFRAGGDFADACWRGGHFLPGCLLFVTYAGAGANLPASPDGRGEGEAIADSIGPHQGRDRKGPTAMLKSVARLDHAGGLGTLVLNLRLAAGMFQGAAGRQAVIDLVRGFFDLGGMQLQVSVIDQDVLRDAMAHPDRHENLIVRIGGYSEYFNRLGPDLQRTVLERTEHQVVH